MNNQTSRFIDDYHLLTYDNLDSTNEEAKRLSLAGGQHGAVIWATEQTAGKGRDGRTWQSLSGNLHFSLLLRPHLSNEILSQLSFVTSLALFRAVRTLVESDGEITIKWPNDLLLDGAKLAGILLETCYDGAGDPWVVIGVGVNVEKHPIIEDYPTTSLKAAGLEIISAKIVLSRFLNMFENLYDEWVDHGFKNIRQQWLAHAAYLHDIISLQYGDEQIKGEFSSIDECGNIMLKSDGQVKIFAVGEVHLKTIKESS
jgi:BirA family biotin operon repressor/biotin-[acetyl-CoA-carboxylase] ligase